MLLSWATVLLDADLCHAEPVPALDTFGKRTFTNFVADELVLREGRSRIIAGRSGSEGTEGSTGGSMAMGKVFVGSLACATASIAPADSRRRLLPVMLRHEYHRSDRHA